MSQATVFQQGSLGAVGGVVWVGVSRIVCLVVRVSRSASLLGLVE